ncbi:hypothetical protein ASPCAL02671 [Aspergillus calidoustus]|uniref:Uncharacterized protein n=1 Tax=Aspergillus calidoustus TaxID=454130 RepID=A0A0U5GQX4_ASPCI|nr:hypothetical protein ASPCAL02671 [Aspergillus calidoustus]
MSSDSHSTVLRIFSTEIWINIVNILRWDSWTTLHSLNLSCQAFHQIVSPVLFRTLQLHFPPAKKTYRAQINRSPALPCPFQEFRVRTATGFKTSTYISSPAPRKERRIHALLESDVGHTIQHHVRILIVWYGHGYEEGKHSQPIQRLVENLPNLEAIRWRGIPFPPNLAQNLSDRLSPPQLYYEGLPQAITSNSLFIGASFIKSLSITCEPAPVEEHVVNKLGKLILSLSRLERLILKQAGDRYWRDNKTLQNPAFRLAPDSKLPPSLRILSFTNFTFNEEQAAAWARCARGVEYLALDGYMQLSTLLEALSGPLSGLKSLTLRVLNDEDHPIGPQFLAILDRFLQSIAKLECFSTYNFPKSVLVSVIRYHGNHLRQLRFRETGYSRIHLQGPEYKDCLFSRDELYQLANELPHVERLGLDLRFEDKIHYDYLDALARFSSLKYLELNTPSYRGAAVNAYSSKFWLDKSVTREVFQYVDARTERRLAGLDIKVGEWEWMFVRGRNRTIRDAWIYAAWRESDVPNLVHVTCLSCEFGGYLHLSEDDIYEQTVHAAGLWPSDRSNVGPVI